ncbi:hypothetical protein [Coralliovum pocilloporae]|uniref:hypothetical protein n=1 Tax=Coralliovum pocilloporae TaxID=3066369 RepID=UPI0033077E60
MKSVSSMMGDINSRLMRGALVLGAAAAMVLGTVSLSPAAEDTPFHAGVWELPEGDGFKSLVISDWLLFEGQLPKTWLYLESGSAAEGRYTFLARHLNGTGYLGARIDVARIDDTHMTYKISTRDGVLTETTARRLSVPNAKKSCLAVLTKLEDLLGAYASADGKTKKKLVLTKDKLTWNGQDQAVSVQQLRVGQVGISANGKPLAILADAGSDYAVIQWLHDGEKSFTRGPRDAQLLSFKNEEVLYRSRVNCNKQIKDRLKFMGKGKKKKKKS